MAAPSILLSNDYFQCKYRMEQNLDTWLRHKMQHFNLTQIISKFSIVFSITLSDCLLNAPRKITFLTLCYLMAEICDTRFSAHFPVLFTAVVSGVRENIRLSVCHTCMIHPSTSAQFSTAVKDSVLCNLEFCTKPNFEELTTLCNSACTDILDSLAPLKTKESNHLFSPG